MSTVFANGFSIIHLGDGLSHTCAVPDVCKTPAPSGTVPIPYVNVAADASLTSTATKTNIANTPVANAGSKISVSNGDNAGVIGGVVSGTFMGQMSWGSFSFDVKVEGKGVVRFLDVTLHNGSTPNCAFISTGSPSFGMGATSVCPNCGSDPSSHVLADTKVSQNGAQEIFERLAERYKEQRPLLLSHLDKRRERVEAERSYEARLREASTSLDDRKKITAEAQLIFDSGSTVDDNRAERAGALDEARSAQQEAEEAIETLKRERQQTLDAIDQELCDINTQIEDQQSLLHLDTATKTYSRGYMVGACVCRCGDSPKLAAACSGEATPGFRGAVGETSFELAESFYPEPAQREATEATDRPSWECAGPKLLSQVGGAGHKIKSVSERFFDPFSQGARVMSFQATSWGEASEEGGEPERQSETQSASVAHGEAVPPCESCQELLTPELCDIAEECGG